MSTATVTATPLDLRHVHIVLRGRGFVANGIQRERGEILDTSDWRLTSVRSMVDQRILGAADYSLNDTAVTCECGRMWENEERAADHSCPARKD